MPRVRFLDLRHTAASLMLNHGILVIVMSRMLGHSKPSVTLDLYGLFMPGMQSEAAGLMDNLVHQVSVELRDESASQSLFRLKRVCHLLCGGAISNKALPR